MTAERWPQLTWWSAAHARARCTPAQYTNTIKASSCRVGGRKAGARIPPHCQSCWPGLTTVRAAAVHQCAEAVVVQSQLPTPAAALLPPLTSKHLNTTGSTTAVSPAHQQHNSGQVAERECANCQAWHSLLMPSSRITMPWARCCYCNTALYCHGLPPCPAATLQAAAAAAGPCMISKCCRSCCFYAAPCSEQTAALSLVRQHTVVLTQRQGMEPQEGPLRPSMPLCLHERPLPVSLGIFLAGLLA